MDPEQEKRFILKDAQVRTSHPVQGIDTIALPQTVFWRKENGIIIHDPANEINAAGNPNKLVKLERGLVKTETPVPFEGENEASFDHPLEMTHGEPQEMTG